MAKTIVCRCEDVTLHDVEAALARGYRDIEEVKRYTGFGTGPCQGKECLREVALLLAARTGADPATVRPFTARPPLAPLPLKLLARVELDGEPAGEHEPERHGPGSEGEIGPSAG